MPERNHHPVRKRIGLNELNALLLPVLLLPAALIAVTVQAAIVATAPAEVSSEELAPLRVPEGLAFERTRRVAAERTTDVFVSARTQLDGLTLADHVQAMAQHRSLADRPARPSIEDVFRPSDSLESFARRWRISVADLQELNPEVDLAAVQPDDLLFAWSYEPDAFSRSLGHPNRGRLERGEPMPEGGGWIVRNPTNSWGTRRTIDALIDAARLTQAEHPGGQEVMIADISRFGGGRFPPHRSHQSGRDVDVTYFRRGQEPPTFSAVSVNQLDLERTWAFVRALVTRHDVHYIFMSQSVQRALYTYASSQGEHPAFLDRVFATGPDGQSNPLAIIRFAPGHNDHMHIRFGCAQTQPRCAL